VVRNNNGAVIRHSRLGISLLNIVSNKKEATM